MLDALKKLFRYKRIDLEAKMRPTPECTFGGVGEVEFELWSDGAAALEASLKQSGVPNGSDLEVFCGGRSISVLPVAGGYAKVYLTFAENQTPPAISAGDEAEMRLDGVVMYKGTFRRD